MEEDANKRYLVVDYGLHGGGHLPFVYSRSSTMEGAKIIIREYSAKEKNKNLGIIFDGQSREQK